MKLTIPKTTKGAVLMIAGLLFAASIPATIAAYIVAGIQNNGLEKENDELEEANRKLRVLVEQQIDLRVEGCERNKLDRIDSARSASAQASYLDKVLGAASVQEDVKAAADANVKQQRESAGGFSSRLLMCEPLIREGVAILDCEALGEARGKPVFPAECEALTARATP